MRICHQYKIRKRFEKKEPIVKVYTNEDLRNAEIKRIDKRTATEIILKYEYLGSMPHAGSVQYCYGMFLDGQLGGVLVYGDLTTPLKNFPQFNFVGRVVVLHRGVCVHWTPKNSASFFISRSYNMLKEDDQNIKILTATVDRDAGEIGTIYQSLNWHFVGVINANNRYRNFVIDGKAVHPKTLYDRHGTSSMKVMREVYGDRLVIKPYTDKLRYFYFIGSHKENRTNYEKIESKLKPYPKR
jgi:hypothetical protein